MPAKNTGLPVTAVIESAAPPRASPSSLVRTNPVVSTSRMKARAWMIASWPVIASHAMTTRWGLIASLTRRASRIMSSSTWRRPAVSTITTSCASRSACLTPFLATLTASLPSKTTSTPISPPRVTSCSTAAGRHRSAATSNGRLPLDLRCSAIFAHAVVLPEPWTPAIITTAGLDEGSENGTCVPPMVVWSSSRTTLITCWAGVRLFMTSSESARSRTRARRSSATSAATSASSSAVRMSVSAASTCLGWSFPRERSFLKMPSRRSVSVSNIGI